MSRKRDQGDPAHRQPQGRRPEAELQARAQRFFELLAAESRPKPAPAADQWLAIRLRLEEDKRRRALRPLRWVRTLAVAGAAAATLTVPWWRGLFDLLSPLTGTVDALSAPAAVLLSVQGVLVFGLVVLATVFWIEGERWIQS